MVNQKKTLQSLSVGSPCEGRKKGTNSTGEVSLVSGYTIPHGGTAKFPGPWPEGETAHLVGKYETKYHRENPELSV